MTFWTRQVQKPLLTTTRADDRCGCGWEAQVCGYRAVDGYRLSSTSLFVCHHWQEEASMRVRSTIKRQFPEIALEMLPQPVVNLATDLPKLDDKGYAVLLLSRIASPVQVTALVCSCCWHCQ